LFLGENRLGYIAYVMHIREINLGLQALLRALSTTHVPGRLYAAATEMRAHLFGLVLFNRARMGQLTVTQAEFRQHIENLTALDFHLACGIVDSNLAHPPLFRIRYPKP